MIERCMPGQKDWVSMTIENAPLHIADGNYSSKYPKASDFISEGIPFIRANNISGKTVLANDMRFISEDQHNKLQKGHLKAGDILITTRGDIGQVAIVPEEFNDANINAQIVLLRPTDSTILSRYLCHYLDSPNMKRMIKSVQTGVALKQLPIRSLKKIPIHLPPLAEQKRIAGILDAADALRSKRRKSLKELDTLLQSTFIDMFGDPVKNPMGWEMKKLKDISTKILSGNTPKGGREVYVKEGIAFFRSQNVWRNRLDLDDIAYIDEETHLKMRKSSLHNKDILMTKTGRINTENSSLGRAAMFLGEDDSANVNGHVYLIRLQEHCIHEFVLFILTTKEYRDYIRRVCVGGIDKRQINKVHLEEFPIITPPLELQQRFASIVESIERQKELCRSQLEEQETLFASLQQRAFNGEL